MLCTSVKLRRGNSAQESQVPSSGTKALPRSLLPRCATVPPVRPAVSTLRSAGFSPATAQWKTLEPQSALKPQIAYAHPIIAKKSWRGCGSHVPQAMGGVPESEWCSCQPRITINGKEYPGAAPLSIPGMAWVSSWFTGGEAGKKQGKTDL